MIEWLVNLAVVVIMMIIVSPKAFVGVIITHSGRIFFFSLSVCWLSYVWVAGSALPPTTMYIEYEIGESVFLEFLKVLSEYPPQSSNLTSSSLSITQI